MEKGGPYPLIVLPQFGGYWIEDPENVSTPTSLGSSICEEEEEDSLSPSTFGYKLECKGEARAYRRHFLGKVRPTGGGGAPGTPAVPSSAPFSLSLLLQVLPPVRAARLCPRRRGLAGSAPGRGDRGCAGVRKALGVRGPGGDHLQNIFWEVMEWVVFGGRRRVEGNICSHTLEVCQKCANLLCPNSSKSPQELVLDDVL